MIKKVEDIAGWFILLTGRQRSLAALTAGAVSALAMPPFDLFFVLFFTFPVLVWLIDGVASEPSANMFHGLWDGFKPGFFFGFGYFFAGIWWIGSAFLVEADSFLWALPIAVIALPMILALFWGGATALARTFWSGDIARLFMLAACFALFEYLRGLVATGFPWNPIGGAVFFTPLLMQTASITGIYGITAFAVFAFSAAGILVPGVEGRKVTRKIVLVLVVSMLAGHLGYGLWRTPSSDIPNVPEVALRLVQPNIAQTEKFDREKESEHLQTYFNLSTSEGIDGKTALSSRTHLIWPESAFPFLLTERRDTLAAIGAMLPEQTALITGAARAEAATTGGKGFVFNSVYIVSQSGEIVSAADKTHLVPFGEYLPFQEIAESLGLQQLTQQQGGFEPGGSRKLLSTGLGPAFLPLICYEIIFSGDLWNDDQRPEWIINLTNDAWFGNTPGPYQHLRQSVLRGVEEGMPVIRVANNGISGVFDPYGRTVKQLALNERGIIDSPLPIALNRTVFQKYGDRIYWVVFGVFFTIGLFPLAKNKS